MIAENASYDASKSHVVKTHKHGSPLISCRYDPSGRYLFFGAQDYRVWRLDVAADKKVGFDTDAWVRGIAFHPSGEQLLTAGYDGRLLWWPVEADAPQPIRQVKAHQGWVRAVAMHPDGSLIASCGNDNLVKLWSAADGRLVRELAGHPRHPYNVAFHPDGKQLVSGDLMGNLFHWEIESGKLARKLSVTALHKYDKTFKADIGGFRDLEFSKDGKWLACAGITNVTNAFAGVGNPLIELWDWQAGKQKATHISKGKLRGVAWGLALHPGGQLIAAIGGSGGYLLFWKSGQQEAFHQFKLPDNARDLDLSPDALQVATAHFDGNLRITRLAAKK